MAGQEQVVEARHRPNKKVFQLETVVNGFVELRRLNHGESNELSDQRLAFYASQEDDSQGKASIQTKIGRQYSFKKCIIGHNLGHGGKLFDFSKRRDVDDLDPVIGDEIAGLIEAHNETLEESGEAPKSQES